MGVNIEFDARPQCARFRLDRSHMEPAPPVRAWWRADRRPALEGRLRHHQFMYIHAQPRGRAKRGQGGSQSHAMGVVTSKPRRPPMRPVLAYAAHIATLVSGNRSPAARSTCARACALRKVYKPKN